MFSATRGIRVITAEGAVVGVVGISPRAMQATLLYEQDGARQFPCAKYPVVLLVIKWPKIAYSRQIKDSFAMRHPIWTGRTA